MHTSQRGTLLFHYGMGREHPLDVNESVRGCRFTFREMIQCRPTLQLAMSHD